MCALLSTVPNCVTSFSTDKIINASDVDRLFFFPAGGGGGAAAAFLNHLHLQLHTHNTLAWASLSGSCSFDDRRYGVYSAEIEIFESLSLCVGGLRVTPKPRLLLPLLWRSHAVCSFVRSFVSVIIILVAVIIIKMCEHRLPSAIFLMRQITRMPRAKQSKLTDASQTQIQYIYMYITCCCIILQVVLSVSFNNNHPLWTVYGIRLQNLSRFSFSVNWQRQKNKQKPNKNKFQVT